MPFSSIKNFTLTRFPSTLTHRRVFVKIKFLRLQNFRNVAFAEVDTAARLVWVCGQNAQGKSNLLEAMSLLGALRSFRTRAAAPMVKFGEKSAGCLFGLELDDSGTAEVRIEIGEKRSVFVDDERIDRFSDYIGRFPTITLSNADMRLLRGTPDERRRDMDMFLSGIDAAYFESLRLYHSALAMRNALLREPSCGLGQLDAFEAQMAKHASEVVRKRAFWFGKISEEATRIYAKIAEDANSLARRTEGVPADSAKMKLKTDTRFADAEVFARALRESRPSDAERRFTQTGPHRDDFKISVAEKDAKVYASEGQQKSAVLALKLAQFEIFKAERKTEPVILCDDIFGELDESRRRAFRSILSPTAQVVASSTFPAPSDAEPWRTITVKDGTFCL